LDKEHVQYLVDLNNSISPVLPEYDQHIVRRWKLVNELLLAHFEQMGTPRAEQLAELAALAAFPLLEELSRRICGAWDEEGILAREVASGVTDWNPNGIQKRHPYKPGQRIVRLAHKLQLMQMSLKVDLQRTFISLDAVFQRPMIRDDAQPMSPLHERLQFFRDQWMHGRKYEGWEAILVSLIVALLYFGHVQGREPLKESAVSGT